ncbi:MAG: lytic transglycosylase domain-containing protein [Candidatus Phaeomarinobacter sp.]
MAYRQKRAPASFRRGMAAAFGFLCVGAISSNGLAAPAESKPDNKDWQLCRTAAQKVERAGGIPEALLQAMSLVETGRRGPDGKHTAWPWTINSHGKGYRFATKDDAIWAVRRLVADGARSIDVGCMQVNLRYHPRAFTSLEEAFDPAANMAYAASFLTRLKDRHGNWRAASARYHSYNPKLREKYASRVDKTLARERKMLATTSPTLPAIAKTSAPYSEAGTAPLVTASISSSNTTQDLGLRPTLVPGLQRGLDVAPTDRSPEGDTQKSASLPADATKTAQQLAAR